MGRQAYPRTALESTKFVFLFFVIVLHLGDIHYGIIGFIGTVLGLVYFLSENHCYTRNSIGIHTCLMKMYGFLKEFIDFQ